MSDQIKEENGRHGANGKGLKKVRVWDSFKGFSRQCWIKLWGRPQETMSPLLGEKCTALSEDKPLALPTETISAVAEEAPSNPLQKTNDGLLIRLSAEAEPYKMARAVAKESYDILSKKLNTTYLEFANALDKVQTILEFDDRTRRKHLSDMRETCQSITETALTNMISIDLSEGFLRVVSDLLTLQPEKYWIEGLPSEPLNNRSVQLGWFDSKTPKCMYFFKEGLWQHIQKKDPRLGKRGENLRAMADILYKDGHVALHSNGDDKPFLQTFYRPRDKTKKSGKRRVLALKLESVFPQGVTVPHNVRGPATVSPLATP